MPSTHKKDKPWDDGTVDKWEAAPIRPDEQWQPLTEESEFACLFPKYREAYLKSVWSGVTQALDPFGIGCQLDLVRGSMSVKTSRKTYDPAAILNARDLIRLLARSVPFPQAVKIMEEGVACDIIKIGGMVRNKERFAKRRQRILGPNGETLKALELLTECFVMVQGNTVAVMGPYRGLKEVRRVVEDCLNNIHPIYHVKELMIKRELARDPALANENWERFLPQFKKRNVARRKPHKVSEKKTYTPFPPPQQPRKIDKQIESGEYFMKKHEKEQRRRSERKEQQEEKVEAKRKQREEAFIAPEEGRRDRRDRRG